MKKQLLVKVMTTAALLSASIQPVFASTELTDINGSFAKDAIHELVNAGIINGKGNGQFDPTGKISRQDFAIILAKSLKLDVDSAPASSTFLDIPPNSYSYKYVEAAAKSGLINGTGNGTFGYGQTLSRQDMAVLFVRALNYTAGNDVVTGNGATLKFADASSISNYAKDSVAAAVELGLLTGNNNGTFNPKGNASREQVALVASKFLTAQQKIREESAGQPVEVPEPPTETPETPPITPPSNSGNGGSGNNSDNNGSQRDTSAPTAAITSSSPVAVGGNVTVTSTEKGTVYLVPFQSIPATVVGLNALVEEHQANKAVVTSANSETSVVTTGLVAGLYRAIAVDTAGNVSAPSLTTIELVDSKMQETAIYFTSPRTVVLSYSEELDPSHVPTASPSEISEPDITVREHAGNARPYVILNDENITVTGNYVMISLPYALYEGASLTVSYQPHSNDHAIQSLFGKKADAVDEYEVVYSATSDMLNSLITEATTLHNNAEIGSTAGKYSEGAAALLEEAISSAKLIQDNVEAAHAEVSYAVSRLDQAIFHFKESKIQPLELSLAENASFVVNPSLEGSLSAITISPNDPQIEGYDKRSIKKLIQVNRGESFEYFSYNTATQDYGVYEGEEQVATVSVTSTTDDLKVEPGDNGLTITPLEGLTNATGAKLVFTLQEEKQEPLQVLLPVTVDDVSPSVTAATYSGNTITVNISETIYTPFPLSSETGNIQLEYSASGEFLDLDTDTVLLRGNSSVNSVNYDFHYQIDPNASNQIIITLSEQTIAERNFHFPGKFRLSMNGYQDFARNEFQVNSHEIIVPDMPEAP
ncbi:S-layer homology domain-containing protein [Neobacillus mesonae]|nr:S-layer homology domain-containing protein [Neobacillus mesonae]